jgi:hypothetical protein
MPLSFWLRLALVVAGLVMGTLEKFYHQPLLTSLSLLRPG